MWKFVRVNIVKVQLSRKGSRLTKDTHNGAESGVFNGSSKESTDRHKVLNI